MPPGEVQAARNERDHVPAVYEGVYTPYLPSQCPSCFSHVPPDTVPRKQFFGVLLSGMREHELLSFMG